MLKIKDNVDLKELEKFGFEVIGNFAKKIFYEKYGSFTCQDDTWLVVEYRQIWFIENGAKESNERYFGNPQFDTLYDLIKADMVEKIEE